MELLEFYNDINLEIKERIASRSIVPGDSYPFEDLIFTEILGQHMFECGMTHDEPEVSNFDGRVSKSGLSGKRGKLSGYSISDEIDQIDLFVSIYNDSEDILSIPDSDTFKAAEQCLAFLQGSVDGTLASAMDHSHESYGLVNTIQESYDELEQIRIYVLTNGKVKTRVFKPKVLNGKTIKLEVMDIQRLFNHMQEGKPRDELEVNFTDVAGAPLPCIWVPDEMGEYEYAMTAFPGETLRFLYEKYGARILEANVRSFLSQTGKVNKGIATTLREQPERFMAYNNGIVIVADEMRMGNAENGGPGIAWLKGMQIVNGGQTTASMFFTKKKFPSTDLTRVKVPAKIIILRETDSAKEEALISDIARFANSQNKVNESDLSANRPFHIELEKLALSTFCPDGVSRWFYERTAGSYKVMLEREGKTPAGIKNLKIQIPTSRKIIKTELARYLLAWDQRPDSVSQGGQKNFAVFMAMLDQNSESMLKELNSKKFKEIIAKVILYRALEKAVRKQFTAFQANITAYTIASIVKLLEDKLNFEAIWKQQTISDQLMRQLLLRAEEVSQYLNTTSNGRMISEWAKKKECWDVIKDKKFTSLDLDTPEFY